MVKLAYVSIVLWGSFCLGQSDPATVVAGKARFTIITPTLIRIEYSDKGIFLQDPSLFAMNRSQKFNEARIVQNGNHVQIETGKISLSYVNDNVKLSGNNLKITVHGDSGDIVWTPEMKNQHNLGGTRNSLDQVGGFVPVTEGLLARDGWHVIDDSQRFIMQNNWVAQRPAGSGTDWYFFGYGSDYKQALKDLTAIGGVIPLPRKYVLGSWYSRWWPYTSNDYRDIVQQYHQHDFPLDMLVMDMDWHKKNSWTGYSWNTQLFPDAPEYLKWLHEQRLFATLNDHPQGGVGAYEDNYNEFMKDMGRDPSKGEVLPFNMGDQRYITTLFKDMHDPLEKTGVDFWWVDWMGDSDFTFNRMDWVNEFYYNHSTENGLRGEQFSRWADWGDHRHPIHFSGDTHIAWSTLQFEIPFTANSSNAGAFYWTHDLGGFVGLRNGELLARWTQFGAVSAAMRLHSTNHIDLDKRPWSYDTKVENSMRTSFHLRSEIFPYVYSSAWEATNHSLPLVRPLYVEFPHDENAYKNPQEYLFGDIFLAAPITSPGSIFLDLASQEVWFPPGDWYDWFTGEHHPGSTEGKITASLDTFPLFVKGGIPLPLQPYTERMTTEPLRTLVVRTYPGSEGQQGKYTLYEDDGLTRKYETGDRATTDLSYLRKNNVVTMTVDATQGHFEGQLTSRGYEFQLPQTSRSKWVTVNGQHVTTATFDTKTNTNSLRVAPADIQQKMQIQFWF